MRFSQVMIENSSALVVCLVNPGLRLPRDFLRRTDVLARRGVGQTDMEAEVPHFENSMDFRQNTDAKVLVHLPGVDTLHLGGTPVETLPLRDLVDSLRNEGATSGAQRLGNHTDILLAEDTVAQAAIQEAEDQEVCLQNGDWQRQNHVQHGTDGSIPLSGHPNAAALVKIYLYCWTVQNAASDIEEADQGQDTGETGGQGAGHRDVTGDIRTDALGLDPDRGPDLVNGGKGRNVIGFIHDHCRDQDQSHP